MMGKYSRSQESGVRSQESGVRSQESGVRKKEEGRRKKEEGRRKKEEGRRKIIIPCSLFPVPSLSEFLILFLIYLNRL
jgi:hypothetical protein